MARYWFVRHGQSLAQISDWTGPDPEVPLSDAGREQARALALQLPALPVERALCSPFARALETAALALERTRHVPTHVHGLRERYAGDWLRLYRQDARMQRQLARWDFRPPNGESIRDATLRGLRALAEIESPEDTIVFSHGRIIAGLLTILDGKNPLAADIFAVPNCTLIEREVAPGAWAALLGCVS